MVVDFCSYKFNRRFTKLAYCGNNVEKNNFETVCILILLLLDDWWNRQLNYLSILKFTKLFLDQQSSTQMNFSNWLLHVTASAAISNLA